MKHSEAFGDVDPLLFEEIENLNESQLRNPVFSTTIVNEPPKIPFIHRKDMLKKCPKLT